MGHSGNSSEIQIERGVGYLKSLLDGSSVPKHAEHVTFERAITVSRIERFKNTWQVDSLSALLPGAQCTLPKLDDDDTGAAEV